ncbi:uncharacterized protein N7484_009872 [Penicillium longicatenatum]|uniref:uncharacterized protein n=1 Tax=Penicillium longicatenatum TaxID=1561947 RepID=UPI002548E5F9|nr:uncharacterized protein N7484_009872 [Penicillium longicatenatum]KAJ5636559.1 hypothetical protein N7484_009872 [Penicillium longicatenatum]
MTDLLRPGLQPVSHLKAGPTTSSSRSTALPSPIQPSVTRPSSRLRTQRASHRDEAIDAGSEKATLALIRRVLCPQASNHGASSPQPPEELLPPLTSSNDVDRQLYAILAIIMKEFVYSWYSKITPDQTFVNEVLHVIAHCTRALEQRIRKINAGQLILDEIPALVEAHITSYRLAKQRSHLSGLTTSHRALYHEMNPHPGLSPVPDFADPDTINAQSENEAVYRQLLVQGTLAILLPTDDLENGSLRTLVGDILADLILGKAVGDRICEGVFLYEVTIKLTEIMRQRKSSENTGSTSAAPTNRLEKYGLLSTNDEPVSPQPISQSQVTVWIWNVLQIIYVCYVALRFIATGLFRVASNPGPGSSHGAGVSFPVATPELPKEGIKSFLSDDITNKRPVLDYRVVSMASQLFGMSRRMPWLSGLLALIQHLILAGPGRIGDTDGVLDRFLRETIEEYVLPPTLLPNLLLATRTTLFPANARPVAVAATTSSIGAPATTPQVSVPALTLSAKGLTTAPAPQIPHTEKVKVIPGSEAIGKSSVGSSSNHATSGSNGGSQSSGGVNDQLPAAPAVLPGPTPSPLTAEAIQDSTNSPTGSEKKSSLPDSEIATTKRRCAASLLALIPPSVARTFFGVPASSKRDGTCSTTTGSLSSLTTSPSSPSPPVSSDESGGGQSSQGTKRTSPCSFPHDPSASTLPGPKNGDFIAAETSRTDMDDETEVGPDKLFLLQSIETDLLDPFSDEYCNKHLVYSIIETVFARILPELAEHSVADLMEDRGIVPVPAGF